MTETPAALVAVVALWFLSRAAKCPSFGRVAAAGAAMGLAALCRPTFLVWIGLVAVMFPLTVPLSGRRWRTFVILAAGSASVISPWSIRNQVQFGRPVLGTTHGGFTLLLGNNPSFYEYLRSGRPGTVWDAGEFNAAWRDRVADFAPASERESDRLAYALAWQTIRRQPGMFVYSCLVRAGRFWGLVPHRLSSTESPWRTAARYAVGLWYLIEFGLAAVGLAAAGGLVRWMPGSPLNGSMEAERYHPEAAEVTGFWRTGWIWGVLLALALTGVHSFYWSNLRMRAPLVPAMATAATAGAAWLASFVPRRKPSSHSGL